MHNYFLWEEYPSCGKIVIENGTLFCERPSWWLMDIPQCNGYFEKLLVRYQMAFSDCETIKKGRY